MDRARFYSALEQSIRGKERGNQYSPTRPRESQNLVAWHTWPGYCVQPAVRTLHLNIYQPHWQHEGWRLSVWCVCGTLVTLDSKNWTFQPPKRLTTSSSSPQTQFYTFSKMISFLTIVSDEGEPWGDVYVCVSVSVCAGVYTIRSERFVYRVRVEQLLWLQSLWGAPLPLSAFTGHTHSFSLQHLCKNFSTGPLLLHTNGHGSIQTEHSHWVNLICEL